MKNKKYLRALIILFTLAFYPSMIQAAEVSFSATHYFVVGQLPEDLALGDLNGDGNPDIASANYGSDNVSILLGNGDGTFQTAVNYATGAGTCSVSLGDLNGDGHLDMATANYGSDNVSVLLGNGDGTFQAPVNYAAGDTPESVALGDFNGDGDLDVAVANNLSNDVSILLGNGDGTFQTAVNYAVGNTPMQLEIDDLNNDGTPDIVTANKDTDNVSVLLGNGDGTFQAAVNYAAGDVTRSPAIGDLNNDGVPDIAAANWSTDYVSVLIGNGDGTFQNAVNYAVGGYPFSVAIGDLNGDGDPDIATTTNSNVVSILLGNGSGTFQAAVNYPVGVDPLCVSIGDLNGDNKPDIFTTNTSFYNVSVLLNNTVAGSNAGETLITTTQEYYTGYFTNFAFQTGNNVFEEADGTLHAAYVENYELYYLKSVDGGTTWSKENIASEHNGDVKMASLTVDHDGNVFIGFSCNDYYNYSNPTGVSYGFEFYEDLYCINNKSGSWNKETIYAPVRSGFSDNYGPRPVAMLVDADNDVHLFANRGGWYTYGGTAWEWIRDAGTDTWGTQITAADPSGSLDRFIYDYYRPLIDSTGKITLIMSRYNSNGGVDDYLFYTQKNGSWSGITVIDQPNRAYASTYHFDAAIDGSDNIYLVYLKDLTPGVMQILFSTNFASATPIYTGASGENIYDLKLHSDSAGNLTLFFRHGTTGAVYSTKTMKRSSGGSWAIPSDLSNSAPDNDVFYLSVARTDTLSGVFNNPKLTYFDREVTGQTSPGPYGPDKFYFNNLSQYELTMQVSGNGSTTPAVGTHNYTAGTVVNINATPASGWQFFSWTGNVTDPNSSSTTVTLDNNKTVTATFSEIPPSNWTQINSDGFGDANNYSAYRMVSYNNRLYVGIWGNNGAQVWEYDGSNWTNNTPSWDASNSGVNSMAVHNGLLYVGTYRSGGAEIWAFDGSSWNQANTDGFGDVNIYAIDSMAVYNGGLYAGIARTTPQGVEVWGYVNGTTWNKVTPTAGFGDSNNLRPYSMVEFNGKLYVGASNFSTGVEIWGYDGSNWSQTNSDGFGDVNNQATRSMAAYGGHLYTGTCNSTTGGEVWRYDGSTWGQVNSDGFGSPYNTSAKSMLVYGSMLYAGTDNYTMGAEVWRYDGSAWSKIIGSGFGDPNNWYANSMAELNPLYVGTYNQITGAEIWKLQTTYDLTVSVIGNGSVTLDPTGGSYEKDTVVQLTATGDPGWHFDSWTGNVVDANSATTSITMDTNKTITATFAINTYMVTFTAGTGGNLTGTTSQTVISGSDCTAVTANPDPGYQFTGWTGDYIGTDNPLTITNVTSNMNISATFTEIITPDQPSADSPKDNAVIASGDVTLQSGDYVETQGDEHEKTHWRVRRFDRIAYIHEETSISDLIEHTVSGLDGGLKYVWQVAYEDSLESISPWSQEYTFTVGTSIQETMPQIYPGTEIPDFKMMSFPFWCDNPIALSVFGVDYNTTNFRIGRYYPHRGSGEYVEITDPEAAVNPGEGAWVLARNGLQIPVTGVPVSLFHDIEIPLYYNTSSGNGWNQIGCPNAANYYWGDVEVIEYDQSGNIVFGPTAISDLPDPNDYIDVRIWKWVNGAYDSYGTGDIFLMEVYEGYWVKVKKENVYLRFPVSVQVASVSNPGAMFASLLNKGKRWMKKSIFTTQKAIADSGDSPPMPMGGFTSSGGSGSSADGDSGGGGGGCFIATAAYGSPTEHHVKVLRDFRDRYLLSSKLGRMFVETYYRFSPPVAEFISRHDRLKAVVRIGLLPLVGISYSVFHFGVTFTATGMLLIFFFLIFLTSVYGRRVV